MELKSREMTSEERMEYENIFNTTGFKLYTCRHCEDEFAARPDNVGDGFCGICYEEVKRELRDSHGLEGPCEDDFDEDED